MKMPGRKVTSFITLIIVYTGLYILTLFKAPDILKIVGVPIIIGLAFTAAFFIGGVVWSTFIKSKFFRQELHDDKK